MAAIRDGADKGLPATLDKQNPASALFIKLAQNTAQQLAKLYVDKNTSANN